MSFSSKFTGKNPINKQDPPNQSNAFSNIEHKAEEVLNFPQEKARQRTDEYLNITPDEDGLMKEQNSFLVMSSTTFRENYRISEL